jgi:hypothetical protein
MDSIIYFGTMVMVGLVIYLLGNRDIRRAERYGIDPKRYHVVGPYKYYYYEFAGIYLLVSIVTMTLVKLGWL